MQFDKHIVVNMRHVILGRMDGIGRFSWEVFRRMALQHPNYQFTFVFDRPPKMNCKVADNVFIKVLRPKARHPIIYVVWYQLLLLFLLKRLKPDVFVATDGMFPLKTSTPVLAVIHDLNFVHFPQFLPWVYSYYYKRYFPKFAKDSQKIATVSNYSREDIERTYGVSRDKIKVVYNGVTKTEIPAESLQKTRDEYSKGKPYFLFVGTIHPRKNLTHLLKAFDQFKKTDTKGVKLLIVGRKLWWTAVMEKAYLLMKNKSDVVFLGRISDDELVKIYASAYLLAYVPFFEGFGIPLIEAMQYGVPAITSNVTSMPEVVLDSGVTVSPKDVEAISDAMNKLVNDPEYYAILQDRCRDYIKRYSWENTATLLSEQIHQLL